MKDVLVIIDREQGGADVLGKHGYQLYSILTMHEMLDILVRRQAITPGQHAEAMDYLNK